MKVHNVGDQEVEDVVTSLTPVILNVEAPAFSKLFKVDLRRLVGHTGLLEQVGLNISSSHTAHVVEPHTDELTEPGQWP